MSAHSADHSSFNPHHGMARALYGPWDSRKSTVLSYVEHYFRQQPARDRTLVLRAGPWEVPSSYMRDFDMLQCGKNPDGLGEFGD